MNQRLVIFDLDGTLYQTHLTSVQATQKALMDCNLPPVRPEVITSLFGETMDAFCSGIAPHIDSELKQQLAQKIHTYERRLVAESGKLFDGVIDLLCRLKQSGFALAICSNGSIEYVNTVLTSCRIAEYFSYIKSRDAQKTKSDLIYELLCEVQPTSAIAVGDRIHDFNAARENRIPFIGVAYGYGGDEIDDADFKAAAADDIIAIIRKCAIFDIVEFKFKAYCSDTPFVIGVNGVDTSGKSQVTLALNTYLISRGYKTQVIHVDDFHNPRKIRLSGENEIDSYINHAFNLSLLKSELLAPIKNGNSVDKDLTLLDLDSDTYINHKHYRIDGDTIVIVEGVLLYRAPIDDFFDCRIFLDIGFDEVLRRAEIRDVPVYGIEFLEKYKSKYIPIQQWYLSHCKPKERSDIVIENTDYNCPIVVRA